MRSRANLARQLETIDLAMSTNDDAEAARLAASAKAFPALAALVLDETYVTKAGAKAVQKAIGARVTVTATDPKEYYDRAEGQRFVRVSE